MLPDRLLAAADININAVCNIVFLIGMMICIVQSYTLISINNFALHI